jgi:hypothetical protein
MSKYAAAWFIQHKLTKFVVGCNETRLIVQSLTRWWIYAANNDVAYFAFGMATNNMDCFD